jgi:hypothetical protein
VPRKWIRCYGIMSLVTSLEREICSVEVHFLAVEKISISFMDLGSELDAVLSDVPQGDFSIAP